MLSSSSSSSNLKFHRQSHARKSKNSGKRSILNKQNMNLSTNYPMRKSSVEKPYRESEDYLKNFEQQQNNLDNASLQDMIDLLKQYEKMCLQKQDFSSAEEAKNKIQFLKSQQVLLKREQLEIQDKKNMQNVSKQGQQQVRNFQAHWDQQLQELIEALKEVEQSLTEQHERQLCEIQEKLENQKPPRIKYSSQVLELRKYLTNLIKVKNYKQAQITKQKLQMKQKQQQQKWIQAHQIKKKSKFQVVVKKQQNELKALRVRLQAAFNQKLKQRDHKFQTLLKKNRKRKIESGKISRQRLKTKTALLNESKSYMQSTMGAIGTGQLKF